MTLVSGIFASVLAACALAGTAGVYAQSPLDRYIDAVCVVETVAGRQDSVDKPRDLAFHPDPERAFELWVLNRETDNTGSTVILYNAGQSGGQQADYRQDLFNGHFMTHPAAIAFGDNGYFATVQEVLNTNGIPGSTFMGPTLWSSDTSMYARVNQHMGHGGDYLLGSHLDMLHQSPFGMGVEHDHDNVYWVFDGYHGNICRYDFAEPHIPGGDDHSDGRILRYDEVTVQREPDIPGHMALDRTSGYLYIVDTGNRRVLRLNTASGVPGVPLIADNEPLAEYRSMDNVEWEVYIDSGFNTPCGIACADGRLVVGDYATGDVILYSTEGDTAQELRRIATDRPGIMGIAVGPDGMLWTVDYERDEVLRLVPNSTSSAGERPAAPTVLRVYPNPAFSTVTVSCPSVAGGTVSLVDLLGTIVYTVRVDDFPCTVGLPSAAEGLYTITVDSGGKRYAQSLLIRR